MANLLVTIPHSGERIPEKLTPWLLGLPEKILMEDVDRFVDQLYLPSILSLGIPFVKTEWHRYAVDLNRIPTDVDRSSVEGAPLPKGTHPRGYHWVETTYQDQLMPQPMTSETHKELTRLIYDPFHQAIGKIYQNFKATNGSDSPIFHLDAHSMPSLGTSMHRDPGQIRADIVISDCLGKSCSPRFRDLVLAAYAVAGFKVAYNWPYFGGRVTEQYGDPGHQKHHAIQVEIRRDLYMDESTKKLKAQWSEAQQKVYQAINYICLRLPTLIE